VHWLARIVGAIGAWFIRPAWGGLSSGTGLSDEGFDAIVLAAAGLTRLGLGDRITQEIPLEISVPAVAQGVLGLEIRSGDAEIADLIRRAIHDPAEERRVVVERAFLARMGGSCETPLAAHAIDHAGDQLRILGLCGMPDGSKILLRRGHRPDRRRRAPGPPARRRPARPGRRSDPRLDPVVVAAPALPWRPWRRGLGTGAGAGAGRWALGRPRTRLLATRAWARRSSVNHRIEHGWRRHLHDPPAIHYPACNLSRAVAQPVVAALRVDVVRTGYPPDTKRCGFAGHTAAGRL